MIRLYFIGFILLGLCALIGSGCISSLSVDKRPSIAVPIIDNNITSNWVVVDQGYEVSYWKWGFNTEIQSLQAEITTNREVKFSMGGMSSIAPTNIFQISTSDILEFMNFFREVGTNDIIVVDSNRMIRLSTPPQSE